MICQHYIKHCIYCAIFACFYITSVEKTDCFTWRVRHRFLCKLEQHHGIPRATRSVSEQYLYWTSYPSNTEILLAFTQITMSNMSLFATDLTLFAIAPVFTFISPQCILPGIIICCKAITTWYQTFYILCYLRLHLHYFCLNTVCFTWRVRHKCLCKLEQHQGIPRATRSVSEQYIIMLNQLPE